MAVQRLQKELKLLNREPLPGIVARPNPKNLLEWHYVLTGDEASDHAGGSFHGKVTFPSQYPFRPPDVVMVTPSGRFAPNTRICMSMTSFHPESWNPMWSVSSILAGLQSFFYESTGTTGSVTTSRAEKRRLAAASMAFNVKNASFRKVFPDLVEEHAAREAAAAREAETRRRPNTTPTSRRPGADPGTTRADDEREGVHDGSLLSDAQGYRTTSAAIIAVAVVGVLLAWTAAPMFEPSRRA